MNPDAFFEIARSVLAIAAEPAAAKARLDSVMIEKRAAQRALDKAQEITAHHGSLENRAAALDERERALKVREAGLAKREAEVAEIERITTSRRDTVAAAAAALAEATGS